MSNNITSHSIISSSYIRLKNIQQLLVVGIVFIMGFMVADLDLLPASLHHVYYVNRLGMQLPIALIFIALTFTPFYPRIHHHVLWIAALGFTYTNYWLTVQCWLIADFAFHYEGVLLYTLFATFIMRLSFKYSAIYIALSALGFCLMVTIYPIYAELTTIKVGLVLLWLAMILMGVRLIEQTFRKLTIANQQLTTLSQIDQLTGIYNRGTFETKFHDMLSFAKKTSSRISVFMIDLDHFKDFNDGYGHLQGDKIIKMQAQILNEVFSTEFDLIARYGGEEFVVACVENTQQQCEILAQQVITKWQDLRLAHGTGNGDKFISCSIGLYSTIANHKHHETQMLENADKSLYQAKNMGRARFVNNSSNQH